MGKLHKIRRAIEREPEKWFYRDGQGRLVARGARICFSLTHGKHWQPVENWKYKGHAYSGFVRSVLAKLGHSLAA